MRNRAGFIEWVLVAKIFFVAIMAAGGTYFGMDLLPSLPATPAALAEPVAKVEEIEVVHWGIVQDIELGFSSKMITFADGVKVVVPKECDAFRGVNLKITSGAEGMRCGWWQ